MLNSEPLFSSNYRLCVVAATNDLEVFWAWLWNWFADPVLEIGGIAGARD